MEQVLSSLEGYLDMNPVHNHLSNYAKSFVNWSSARKAIYFSSLYGLIETSLSAADRGGSGFFAPAFRKEMIKQHPALYRLKPIQLAWTDPVAQGVGFSFLFIDWVLDQIESIVGKNHQFLLTSRKDLHQLRVSLRELKEEGKNPEYIERGHSLDLDMMVGELWKWSNETLGPKKSRKFFGSAFESVKLLFETYPAFSTVLEILPANILNPSDLIRLSYQVGRKQPR